jgi:ubiquinone/menaquinone biosynthesis C-methylase UbiE
MIKKKILKYWNIRAKKKSLKCTNDKFLEDSEIKYITSIIQKGSSVLDIGCGDGNLLRNLKKKLNIRGVGIDFSKELINSAKKRSRNIKFYCIDMIDISSLNKSLKNKFDYIITKRSIQNLTSWSDQKKFINQLSPFCKKKTSILFFESSSTALFKINNLRISLGLKKIVKPWHNLYLDDNRVIGSKFKNIKLVNIHELFSTYYFLSRVINAIQNKKNNTQPKYSDALNLVGWKLPQNLTDGFSQLKLYQFKSK